jgi:hypothetical protein
MRSPDLVQASAVTGLPAKCARPIGIHSALQPVDAGSAVLRDISRLNELPARDAELVQQLDCAVEARRLVAHQVAVAARGHDELWLRLSFARQCADDHVLPLIHAPSVDVAAPPTEVGRRRNAGRSLVGRGVKRPPAVTLTDFPAMVLIAAIATAAEKPAATDLLSWLGFGIAVLSALFALLGAWIGGRMAAKTADNTLRATQQEARERAAEDRARAAAVDLVGLLLDARDDLLGEDGQLLPSAVIARPLRRLQREVAVRLPQIAGRGLDARIGTLLEIFPIERQTVETFVAGGTAVQARVAQRLAHDRVAYLEWVVTGLQDLAAGRPIPADGHKPAGIDDPDAPPWTPPPARLPPQSPSDRRRSQLRRGASPGAS